MQKIIILCLALLAAACQSKGGDAPLGRANNFNKGWEFTKSIEGDTVDFLCDKQSERMWQQVSLPHTANIEPLVIKGKQWQGDAYYRKFFVVPRKFSNKHVAFYFEGAMQETKVYLNNELIFTNEGGYLPFYVDVTAHLKLGEENCLLVKLNNENNPQIAPGKPIEDLDFNYYSGIYRNVWMVVKEPVHISNEMEADQVAGGGVFVSYPSVNKEIATIQTKVHVKNISAQQAGVKVELILKLDGQVIQKSISPLSEVQSKSHKHISLSMEVEHPELWSPTSPVLYDLVVNVLSDDEVVDTRTEHIGIRTFSFSADQGFTINDQPLKLRGTNRHQEYPYIGYALSDNANYRDAYKIKSAGFNFVRLSHYPHSMSFVKACDQLGLLVMDAIPGWQFFGDSVFQANAIADVRKMVRRTRNHPSVILWEASLNESGMTTEFMKKAHDAVHQEYPGKDVYTCGWIDEVYDVFIPARQHAKPPYYWNKYTKDKPLLIAEYGDWEYYAQNAGFNQKAFQNLSSQERNSRQLRGDGQKRLMQQALNYQESHNSNLKGSAVGDANWLMFDYNRGYAPDLEASGIMDIFRLPKFAYYFYQSQADIAPGQFGKPMVYIANYYNDPSMLDIVVYSNSDQVELSLNGVSLGKQYPDKGTNCDSLQHPPFTFRLDAFIPGEITAQGFINNEQVVSDSRRTPQEPKGILVWIDESNKPLQHACNDMVFLYAAVVDVNGTIVPDAKNTITYSVEGDAEIIGMNPMEVEAGIATVLLKAGDSKGLLNIKAESQGLSNGQLDVSVL